MSNPLKKLAGQTAIYGISSILSRLLNFSLVPLYTTTFDPSLYGIVSYLFAITAFVMVVMTHGMETSFFRFSKMEGKDANTVYGTSFWSVTSLSLLFLLIVLIFGEELAQILRLDGKSEYLYYLGFIIAMDSLSTLPFARLRQEGKAKRFALVRLSNIAVNLTLNLFFLVLCPYLYKQQIAMDVLSYIYWPEFKIGYIFLSTLAASGLSTILLLPQIRQAKQFSVALWKEMAPYAMPLMVAGLAYIVNEMADKLLLKRMLPEDIADYEIGVYSGCYKLATFMTLFVQAFRYGAEPFFFETSGGKKSKELYAKIMTYFVAAMLLIFLGVNFYLEIIRGFLGKESYYEGLAVVPILLMANLCFGIYFNLSFWYKIIGKTQFGTYISLIGATITIVGNLLLIPKIGYIGSAWATLACYASMVLISYFMGQKYYPVKYQLKRLSLYFGVGLAMYAVSCWLADPYYIFRTIMILGYISLVILIEKPKKNIIFKN